MQLPSGLPRRDGRPADVPKSRAIMPFIMRSRTESSVYFEQTLDVSKTLDWLREWNASGAARAGVFNVVLYFLAQMLHERPRLNRFVAGRKIYDRDGVFLSFGAKKQLSDDAPLAMVKRRFEPTESFAAMTQSLYGMVTEARSDKKSAADTELDILTALPAPLLDLAIGAFRTLDGFGAVPDALTDGDPMYASAVVSNLGSLKMDAAFHHLYEHGNCPLFLAIGVVQPTPVAAEDGSVEVRPLMTLRWTFDERVEDGLYAGKSIKVLRERIEDPYTYLGDPTEGATQPMTTESVASNAKEPPMHQVDDMGSVYLAAENGRTHTHTASLVTVDPSDVDGGAITLDSLKTLVEQRLHLVPPFMWKLATVPLGLDHAYWFTDPDFDLDFHIRELALPAPGDDGQLKEQVARLFSRPLDRSKPLWEMYLIHGLADGRQALMTKIHHAAVDGISGAEILGTLFDLTPEIRQVDPPAQPANAGKPKPPPSEQEMLLRGLAGLAKRPFKALSRLPELMANADSVPMIGTLPGAKGFSQFAATVQRKQRPDAEKPPAAKAPRTSFNGRISAHRRLGFGTLPLDDIKTVKNAFGATVNDVVLAVSAAAIRRWLVEHQELPNDPLTAVVPVSTRTTEQAGTYGNKVTGVVVPIPTDSADGPERIARVHDAMNAAKAHLDAVPASLMSDATQFIPPGLLAQAAQALTALSAMPGIAPAMNVNISNVPGPQTPLYCAGAKIESMVPLAGISDGMGLNITVMSYCGRVDVGIVADREQIPDVQHLADWMAEELADLKKLAEGRAAHEQERPKRPAQATRRSAGRKKGD